jgi:hypothetical protein
MVKREKKVVWKSVAGGGCTVLAWSHLWVKISHPAFKGARVFRASAFGRPFCSFSVPASSGVVLAYRVSGALPCDPALFVS